MRWTKNALHLWVHLFDFLLNFFFVSIFIFMSFYLFVPTITSLCMVLLFIDVAARLPAYVLPFTLCQRNQHIVCFNSFTYSL